MKLALLSDLHANARAQEACLVHAQAQARVNGPSWVTWWAIGLSPKPWWRNASSNEPEQWR